MHFRDLLAMLSDEPAVTPAPAPVDPPRSTKPILCLDFDGVLHAYTSGWQGVDVVADGPLPGAMRFLYKAVDVFDVHVHSSRSREPSGREAMENAIIQWLADELPLPVAAKTLMGLTFPSFKPPAMVTLDDRAVTFTGTFPDPVDLLTFTPWNKT